MERTKEKELESIVRPEYKKFDYKQKIFPIVEKKVYTDSNPIKIESLEYIEVKVGIVNST